MSLIVLNSRGQDPAEFENHGLNLRLGKNTQFCLCGVNLNRPPQTPLQLAISQSVNNGWIIANGGRLQDDGHFHSPIPFRIKEGVYNIAGLEAEMTYAMNGNYLPQNLDTYAGMPVSCWRPDTGGTGGLFFDSAGAAGAEVYSIKCAMTKVVNGMKTRLRSVVGAAGGGEFPDPAGANAGVIPNGIPGPNDIRVNGVDPDYIDLRPSNRCKNFICMDPLWNTANDGRYGAFFGGGGPIPADGTNDGYTWGHQFTLADHAASREWVGKIRCGIVSSKWAGGLGAGGTTLAGSINASGPNAARSRWGIGGTRYDLYWEIGERTGPGAGFQILFYSSDMRKDGNYKNNPATDTLWGNLTIPPLAALAPEWWEICIRPVQVAGAGTYRLEAWARLRTFPGANQVGAVVLATAGAAAGYYEINETDKALYQNLPMFQALSFREQAPIVGSWSIRSIHHNARPPSAQDPNGFAPATELIPFTNPAAQNNALPLSCCFSPTSVNFQRNPAGGGPAVLNPLRYDLISQSNRQASIAPCIGFNAGTIQEIPQAGTALVGLAGDNASRNFESSEPIAVIQLTNIPLHGELGAGSTIWGGSNGGQVLGIAELDQQGNFGAFNLGMNVYSEPSQTNWIDCGNMASDSLNQLKVKITDPTGRKLVGLFPDSTIWLKIRSTEHGQTRTGGVDMRGLENRANW